MYFCFVDTMTILMIATAAVSGFMLLLIVLGGLYILLSKYWIEVREWDQY